MDPRCGLVVDWELTETADLQQAWQSPVQPWREGNQRGGGLLVLLVLRLTTVAGVTLLLQQGHACNNEDQSQSQVSVVVGLKVDGNCLTPT